MKWSRGPSFACGCASPAGTRCPWRRPRRPRRRIPAQHRTHALADKVGAVLADITAIEHVVVASEATIVLYDGAPAHPDIGALWRLAARARVTHFGTSPRFLAANAQAAARPADLADLSRLRRRGTHAAGTPWRAAGAQSRDGRGSVGRRRAAGDRPEGRVGVHTATTSKSARGAAWSSAGAVTPP